MRYDILIVGLGPAGAILAQTLPKHLKVIAVDRKEEEKSHFQKNCGGLLAEDAQKELIKLNLNLPKEILADPQIFYVKTYDADSGLIRNYQRTYLNMDRHRFDMWLISLIPKNVDLYLGSNVKKIVKKEDYYQIFFKKGEEEYQVEAKYIVGADGGNSFVRRQFFPQVKFHRYLSIQQRFEAKDQRAFYACIFDTEITNSYSWALSKDQEFLFGGAYPEEKAKELFERQKQKMKEWGFSFENLIKTEACFVLCPQGRKDFLTGSEGMFLIGEAAGFISPSSLEGLSYAMASARILAEAFETTNPRVIYDKKAKKIKRKLLLKIWKRPFMYWKQLRYFVMKSGMQAISTIEK